MLEFAILPTPVQALLIVVAVLVEAVFLYAGYGYLEDQLGPRVIDTIENI